MHLKLTGMLAALAIASTTAAQSLNIDFGAENGAPPSSFAAAGLPGVWNVVHHPWDFPPPPVLGPFPLFDLEGNPIAATLTATDSLGTFLNDPGDPTGNDDALMRDGLIGYSPDITQVITLSGLENGLYRLITYSWYWPSELYGMVVFVEGSKVAYPVGGPWPGILKLPITHMMHVVQVTDGTIQFQAAGSGPGSFFNGNNFVQGLQLWKIDEAPVCPSDIAPRGGNGNVDVDDLLLVINSWNQSSGPADITGNGIVDVDDLLAVINAWGECENTTPAKCGAPDLGSCYVEHQSAGCSEPACCDAVCTFDPFCCGVEWDALCAQVANIAAACEFAVHPNCGNALAGDCFSTSIPIIPGCDDPSCCAAVCQADPFCCNFGWDSVCVEYANLFCGDKPPACGHSAAGDCFQAHFTPFCNDQECCETVCAMDSFCCEQEWDGICVDLALGNCGR
jgi:hypothetical protein